MVSQAKLEAEEVSQADVDAVAIGAATGAREIAVQEVSGGTGGGGECDGVSGAVGAGSGLDRRSGMAGRKGWRWMSEYV